MSEIGSLVVRLEANTAALQKVDAELAKLEGTIKTFQDAAARAGGAARRRFDELGKTLKAMPQHFQALSGVMALQSGAIADLGEGFGKVGNKLAQIAIMVGTGGVIGVGMAALTGITSLLAFANQDAAEAAERHAESMKKATEELDRQRKATADLERELRNLGKTQQQAAVDELTRDIQKREREIEQLAKQFEELNQRIANVQRAPAAGPHGQMIAATVAGGAQAVVSVSAEEVSRLQERIDLLTRMNAEDTEQIRLQQEHESQTKKIEDAEKRREAAVKARGDAERQAAEHARRQLQAQVRLAQEALQLEEERARKLRKIASGEGLEDPHTRITPRMSITPKAGPDTSRAQSVVDAEFEQAREEVKQSGKSIANALAQVGYTILSRSGELGSVMSSAVQGFEVGGPLGAIAAVFADLVSRSQAFQDTQAAADEAIGTLVEAFEPLAEAMKPLAGLVHNVIGIIADQLGPAFEALAPVFERIFWVLRGILIGVLNVIMALGAAWNAIVGAIEEALNFFGADVDFGRAEINLNGINRAIAKLHETTEESTRSDIAAAAARRDAEEEAGEGLGDLGNAAAETMEQLTNVPHGFKVAAARFESINPNLSGGVGGLAAAGAAAAGTHIGQVNIYAWNEDEAFRKMQRHAERANWQMGGTPLPTPSPYSIPDQGG